MIEPFAFRKGYSSNLYIKNDLNNLILYEFTHDFSIGTIRGSFLAFCMIIGSIPFYGFEIQIKKKTSEIA